MISYSPTQARYFHELTVRFLANDHPRIEQRVQQILTVVLLVAAGRGVALVPASARNLGVQGVVFCELVDSGRGRSRSSCTRSGTGSRPVRCCVAFCGCSTTAMLSEHQ